MSRYCIYRSIFAIFAYTRSDNNSTCQGRHSTDHMYNRRPGKIYMPMP